MVSRRAILSRYGRDWFYYHLILLLTDLGMTLPLVLKLTCFPVTLKISGSAKRNYTRYTVYIKSLTLVVITENYFWIFLKSQQKKDNIYWWVCFVSKDHIIEVLSKWESIDDEIWAKVIVLERNRRIAKAYARAPVLTVNGSEDGFDGFRIGVNGFENPLRNGKTQEYKEQIGKGCKLKMDDSGNILVKRLSRLVFFDTTHIGFFATNWHHHLDQTFT